MIKNAKTSKERRQKRLTVTPLLIRALYKNVNGNEASLKYIRKEFNDGMIEKSDLSLTYGEVVCASFLQILGYVATLKTCSDAVTEGNNRIFYDLGCGTGRAVICAALSPHQFQKVIGIELIPELLESAAKVNICLQDAVTSSCKDMSPGAVKNSRRCSFTAALKPTSRSIVPHLNRGQLVNTISDIISKRKSVDGGDCSLDVVSNELTKQLGHKVYKLSLQPFGKFSKFMKDNSEYFSISDDSQITVLSEYYEGEKESLSGEKPLCADFNSVSEMTAGDEITAISRISCNEMIQDIIIDDKSTDDIQTGEMPSVLDSRCQDKSGNKTATETLAGRQRKNLEYEELRAAAVKSVICSSPSVLEALLPLPEIEFIQGSIFDYEWFKDADVAYAASLLFTDHMMLLLTEQVMKMKEGSWLISLKPLCLITSERQSRVVLRERSFHKMSWQMAEVFIYQISS
jgi:trans-aconitate methyltransferase